MLDIASALTSLGLSSRKAGVSVHQAWLRRNGGADIPTAASIGTQVAKLVRGDAKWWMGQPVALSCLAELLSCAVEDIVPEDLARPRAITFNEFSELRPLLPGQDPCGVRNDVGWLGSVADAAVHSGRHTWILAAAGSGKTLAVRTLRQRHGNGITCITARRIVDAVRETKADLPLVVEVEVADPDTDAAAVVELARRSSTVCVLAPFLRPLRGKQDDRWADSRWRMDPDWRQRLSQWAQTRVPESDRLDPAEVIEWLRVVDPTGTLFSTPGHLLTLLARAYRADLPTAKRPLQELGQEFLAQRLGASTDPWLRHCGASTIDAIVTARLQSVDLSFDALSAAEWSRLVPADLTPARITTEVPKKGTRKKAAEVAPTAVEQPPPLLAIGKLVDAGVLHSTENGRLDVAPWVRSGIEREALSRMVRSGNLAWALLAADHRRAAAVDDALDALTPTELMNAIARFQAASEDEFSTVAGVEAVFAAVGRRMIRTEWRPADAHVPTLQSLGRRQAEHFQRLPSFGAEPLLIGITRQRPDLGEAAVPEWLAAAWTFSLNVPAPANLPKDPGWILPGWSKTLKIADAPENLPSVERPSQFNIGYVHALQSAARRVVRRCTDSTADANGRSILTPWVIIDAPEHGWTVGASDASNLVQSYVGDIVAEFVATESEEARQRVALLAWDVAMEGNHRNPFWALKVLREHSPRLHALVGDVLDLDVFVRTFTPEVFQTGGLGRLFREVPPRLRRAILPALAEYVRTHGKYIPGGQDIVEALDADAVEILVELVADKYGLGAAAARRVWEFDRGRALLEAGAALSRGTESEAYAWFLTAPANALSELLDLLDRSGTSRPAWATKWLAGALPVAGALAPRVFDRMTPPLFPSV